VLLQAEVEECGFARSASLQSHPSTPLRFAQDGQSEKTIMKIQGEPLTDQTLRKMRGFLPAATVVTTVHMRKLRGVTVMPSRRSR
jgi:hypothetical protein